MITKEEKLKIKNLFENGKTIKEIAQIMSKSSTTIRYHLNKMNLVELTKSDVNDKLIHLFNEGKSDEEIGKIIGKTANTVRSTRSKLGLKNIQFFSENKIELSDLQKQFIYGSMLGDLNMKLDEKNKSSNARIYIVHSEKQEELFMKKVEILGEFMGSYKLYNKTPDKRTEKIYSAYRGNSKAHPEFTKIYKIFYPNGIKTITENLLDLITHPIALAFWFMDDGTERGTFATNCFSEEEVDLLINWLLNNWNIKCTKQKNKQNFVIHISEKSRFDFEKLIFPYMVKSMYYKLHYLENLEKSV